jgi:hypothetical protein
VGFLQGGELAHQRVVLGVGDLRIIQLVVPAVVVLDLLAELLDAGLGGQLDVLFAVLAAFLAGVTFFVAALVVAFLAGVRVAGGRTGTWADSGGVVRGRRAVMAASTVARLASRAASSSAAGADSWRIARL